LGLPTAIIKSHPEKKSGRGPGLGKLPKILGFQFNNSATSEDSDFKIGKLVGFARANHKIPPRRKRGRGPGLGELPKIWSFPFNIYAMA